MRTYGRRPRRRRMSLTLILALVVAGLTLCCLIGLVAYTLINT